MESFLSTLSSKFRSQKIEAKSPTVLKSSSINRLPDSRIPNGNTSLKKLSNKRSNVLDSRSNLLNLNRPFNPYTSLKGEDVAADEPIARGPKYLQKTSTAFFQQPTRSKIIKEESPASNQRTPD